MTQLKVRLATPSETDALTALCIRSKAVWGYNGAFMAKSEAALTISAACIARGCVLVAERNSRLLGVASLQPLDNQTHDLSHMFVEPSEIRTGIGRVLFQSIAQLAKKDGAKRLSILADPNAEPFYKRMGAHKIGMAPSDAIEGRLLPKMEYCLAFSSG